MGVQILHPTEGMIMGLTPLHPAEERPLLGRILATGSSMLSHGFLDPVLLSTMWTDENLIWCRLTRTMSDSCMLSQSLFFFTYSQPHSLQVNLDPWMQPFW